MHSNNVGPGEQQIPAKYDPHPLAILIAHPFKVVAMVVFLVGAVLCLLLAAAWFAARLIREEKLELPGVKFQQATEQLVVPAYAGWVPVNPVKPFDTKGLLHVSVSGRVHVAMHHALNFANWQNRANHVPVPLEQTCEDGLQYLVALDTWGKQWQDFQEFPTTEDKRCLLVPQGNVGQLVYAVINERPGPKHIGVRALAERRGIKLGTLSPSNPVIPLAGGSEYVLLAVNDYLATYECEKDLYENAQRLRTLALRVDAECNAGGHRQSERRPVDLSTPESLIARNYDDNAGAFIVQISLEN